MASNTPSSMMQRLRSGWIVAMATVAAVVSLVCVAAPARHAVVGLSMAPGLLPGDVVTSQSLPLLDRGRSPRRFERWLFTASSGTAADDVAAVKRVLGLEGERLSIVDGDVLVDGIRMPPPPGAVAQMASSVWEDGLPDRPGHHRSPGWTTDGEAWRRNPQGSWCWRPSATRSSGRAGNAASTIDWLTYRHRVRDASRPRDADDAFVDSPILDDAPFAPMEHRRLRAVRDFGVAVVLRVPRTAAPVRCFARLGDVGDTRMAVATGAGPKRLAFVAGRLDGHLVAAAWTLPVDGPSETSIRSPLPSEAPQRWHVTNPWKAVEEAAPPAGPPILEFGIASSGDDPADMSVAVERLVVWRDVLHLPPEDGSNRWSVGKGMVFVLGDFPPASRDSRHWGPIETDRLLHPVDRLDPAAVVRAP